MALLTQVEPLYARGQYRYDYGGSWFNGGVVSGRVIGWQIIADDLGESWAPVVLDDRPEVGAVTWGGRPGIWEIRYGATRGDARRSWEQQA